MSKKRSLLFLFICSLVIASLGHLFFILEWFQDRYMVGPNDGLQQMVTFKKLLYDQYSSGNFFYSSQFGLGGGTYSQLAFYFSTSFMFIVTSVIVFLLQSVQLIGAADTLFWANAAVFISISRTAIIIFITATVFHYMKTDWLPAFIGASIYALSAIYFRHVTYWEFFADAMLWIPLLVFAVEKIIREARGGWFIAAVAIVLFNNFYFAYVNLILINIYIVFRWFIPLVENETSKWKQCKIYIGSSILGFGISAISFVPAVYGYLNNHRPPYDKYIPLFQWDNMLFNSRYVLIPALFLVFLFFLALYKHRTFQLFASMSILFIFLHFSPHVASAFNGFSAPQYRWEYMLYFTISGAVAVGLHHIDKISNRQLVVSSLLVISLYFLVVLFDDKLPVISIVSGLIFAILFITILLLFVFMSKRNKWSYFLLCSGILVLTIFLANVCQYGISTVGNVNGVTKDHLLSEKYNGEEQRYIVQQIHDRESNPFFRIDWKVGSLNNTPIVQDFNGTSVYGSIINQHLLCFYLDHLNIDMGRESVSRYATLGNRANLYSLFQGKYMIREKDKLENIPFGFIDILKSDNYVVFENTTILPFVRTAKILFSEKDMEHASALAREHAMLEGAIVSNSVRRITTEIPQAKNIIHKTSLETAGASFNNNTLSVTEDSGGVDLVIDDPRPDTKDYYVNFHLENIAVDQGFTLKVNDYKTTRKSNQSIYKTFDDDLTIRVPKAEVIKIRLPKGNYVLNDLALYQEDYSTLKRVKQQTTNTDEINWDKNEISITYNNENHDQLMMLPIPYEKGWEVTINNEKQTVEKVNYAFLGFQIDKGINHITLVYSPPYFKISLLITVISLLISIMFFYRNRG